MDTVQLDQFIDSLPDKRGSLIMVLHKAQDIYGYLPREVQTHIARKLEVPASRVFGVVTFYSFFRTEKQGLIPVQVCMGTACFVQGADKVLDKFRRELDIKEGETSQDGMYSLGALRCVGACGLAPVVMIGEKVYGRVKIEDVRHIVEEQLAKVSEAE